MLKNQPHLITIIRKIRVRTPDLRGFDVHLPSGTAKFHTRFSGDTPWPNRIMFLMPVIRVFSRKNPCG
jgi:hypothetical protein